MTSRKPRYITFGPRPARRSDFLRADWLVGIAALVIVFAVSLWSGWYTLRALEAYLDLDAALALPGAPPAMPPARP